MKLPDSRAFLVRFCDRMDPTEDLIGRIEHIESGVRARFTSAEELYVFIRGVLAQEADLEVAEELK